MNVSVRTAGNVAILDCSGDVDFFASPDLREALVAWIKPDGPSVLLNMSAATYIDSSGIATLIEGLQLSRRNKARFGLFGLRPNARSVLEVARLYKVFTIFNDEAEALEKIDSVQPFAGL